MKKFLIVIVFLMGIVFNSSSSTCPQYYTPASVSFDYWNGNEYCSITVYYCRKLSDDGYSTLVDRVDAEIPCMANNIFDENLWIQVNQAVLNDLPIDQFPPCPSFEFLYEYKKALCWRLHNTPGANFTAVFEICNYDGLCVCEFTACVERDANGNNPHVKLTPTINGCEPNISPECPVSVPQVPPTGFTWAQEWTTTCYTGACTY
ncbi:MAG: hypothetical protein HW421_1449 [Ignavibacteria bacterium]|nr:hypothetical protein [Ignavibacteria bacterium]